MKPKTNTYYCLTVWLLVVIFSCIGSSTSLEYFEAQDMLYPNFETVINHPKLANYLAKPDTVNLQVVYGWGKDLSLKNPKVGLWISDTLFSLAKQQEDHKAIISAYSLRGQVHRQKADYYNSLISFKDAIRYGENNLDWGQHPNFDKVGINYIYLGDLYYDLDDNVEAKNYYQKGWDILKTITPEMIDKQNEINKNYHRAYTTYEWDLMYAKLKMGLVYTEDQATLDSGISMLQDVYNTSVPGGALLSINSAYYIGKALKTNGDQTYLDYLTIAYAGAKKAKVYELQSEIALYIIESVLETGGSLDISLLFEALNPARKSGNKKILFRFYKFLSDHYEDLDIQLSKSYLDSAYLYRELYFNLENRKEIGKLQADIEYEKQIRLSKDAEEEASLKFTVTVVVLVLVLIFVAVLVYLLKQRQRILRDLEIKNQTISDQKVKLAELINSREKLIGILGHDLRNPIKGIRLTTGSINIKNNDESLGEELKDLEKASEEVEKLLNSILDFAESNLSIPDNQVDIVDLEELVLKSVKLNQNLIVSKDLDIVVDLDIKSVISNRFVVTNIINNTITNAVRFSYIGKTVHITSHSEDGFVILKIQDSGIGISKDNLEKIRRHIKPDIQEPVNAPAGSGFGLLTSISQLEKIGGNLFIESEPGVVTTVLIYLNG